jgi:aryl-alcohol dehydrogenase-like predicted oxidoreductase
MSTANDTLVFGTAGLSALPAYGKALRLLAEAEACGIRHFDTAPLYGRGYAEWILGRHLARSRSRAAVTTKFGLGAGRRHWLHPALAMPLNRLRKSIRPVEGGPVIPPPAAPALPYRRITVEQVRASLAESLERLGRDRIDVYLLHEGLPSFLAPDALDYLLDRKAAGVVGMLGVGTDAGSLAAAAGEDFSAFDILQYGAGPFFPILKARHPDKCHYLHGCFQVAGAPSATTPGPTTSPLRYWAGQNPGGKLLFFSRRPSVIRRNAASCDPYTR